MADPARHWTKALLTSALALGGVASLAAAHRASARPPRPAVEVQAALETEKILPDWRPADGPAAAKLSLDLAGQDCAGAQLVVRPAHDLEQLRAMAEPLAGPGKPLPVRLSRVATIALHKPSGPAGRAGEWPDPLIPDRDALYGEPRRAFPIDVPAERAQAIFVEVCAPARQAAGSYAGAVRLSWTQAGKHGGMSVPLALRVRPFDLPATPPLATAFGFSGYSAAAGHKLPAEENFALTRLYDLQALERGLTLFGGSQNPPPLRKAGDTFIIDWTAYDAEVAPFLDGTASPSGARWTSVELRQWPKLNRDERREWRRQWVAHFRERGWLDRLFAYVHDEPPEALFDEVEAKAAELRKDAPEVATLLTTTLSPRLPSVTLWTPPFNCFDPWSAGVSCPRPVQRQDYAAAEKAGARVFWYLSCGSHGCGDEPSTHEGYRGWPDYVIDRPATAARAMGALAFANAIAGELYFDVVVAYDGGDPWKDQWRFGGNGDGTLYYPGTPEKIGGTHHVPVESLRLIQISRAIGDHSALTLCKALGDGALADRVARELAPGLRSWQRDPAAYSRARSRLYDRIEQLAAKRKLAGVPDSR